MSAIAPLLVVVRRLAGLRQAEEKAYGLGLLAQQGTGGEEAMLQVLWSQARSLCNSREHHGTDLLLPPSGPSFTPLGRRTGPA
jgi:hypothetical protein